MAGNPTVVKTGHFLAKILGIKLQYRDPADPVTRGESAFSVDTAETYYEAEPTTAEWIRDNTPSQRDIGLYFYHLFPFLQWIGRYNLQWLAGDLIAGSATCSKCLSYFADNFPGITVGAVVVPQGMAYAKLAELPVQFGLYSSFMGVLIYWFFATSKDITIGVSSCPFHRRSVLTRPSPLLCSRHSPEI